MEQIDYCTLPVSASTAKDDKVRACDLCVRSAAVYGRTGVLACGSVWLLLFIEHIEHQNVCPVRTLKTRPAALTLSRSLSHPLTEEVSD